MHLDTLQHLIGHWQRNTFPSNTKDSVLVHLAKEVKELQEGHDPSEAADCLFMLIRHAELEGYSLEDELWKKFQINKKRKWGAPDKDGVIEHV